MNETYVVSYGWYDSYHAKYVVGPEVDDWENYCSCFLETAAENLLKQENDGFIDKSKLRDSLVTVLAENGYEEVQLPEFSLWGTLGLRNGADYDKQRGLSEEIIKKVQSHNQKVADELYSK